ncbi:MAG: hypothetical protein A2Y78_06705 [Acidobacteria bacterium RBG_13_68_16]|nr:MAG: hypothetical protein A2Y78_06705 [Acidobacteria bacterium RBG_13_68_16]
MKTQMKKPSKNEQTLAALRARHPTTKKEAAAPEEETEAEEAEVSDEETDDDESEAEEAKAVTPETKRQIKAQIQQQKNDTMKTTTKKPAPSATTAIAKKGPSAPAKKGNAEILSYAEILEQQRALVQDEDAIQELITEALKGIGAYYKWVDGNQTFRLVPPPIPGMLPVSVVWSHWLDSDTPGEKGRGHLCAKKMAGEDCEYCNRGMKPSRAAIALGYAFNNDGSTNYEPKIFRLAGGGYIGLMGAWGEDVTIFDMEKGYNCKVHAENAGKKEQKLTFTMGRKPGPAFPDEETADAFYSAAPVEDFIRAVTYVAQEPTDADEVDEEDDFGDA